MIKFTSIITVTFPSEPAFEEWYKITRDFFLKDENSPLF